RQRLSRALLRRRISSPYWPRAGFQHSRRTQRGTARLPAQLRQRRRGLLPELQLRASGRARARHLLDRLLWPGGSSALPPHRSKRGNGGPRMKRIKLSCVGLGLATLLCGPLALGEPRLTGRAVPPLVRGVLLEILQAAKLESVQVTSTSRTAAEQAKVMFDYINRSGYQAALDLYGPHGDEIVKVCTESYRKHERC